MGPKAPTRRHPGPGECSASDEPGPGVRRPDRRWAPTPERRLAELGLELPAMRPKAARYEGWVLTGELLFLSGRVPTAGSAASGPDLTVEDGRVAAYCEAARNDLGTVGS